MEELFSKRLNELISNSNYTLDKIEEYVGKTNATISRYASGEITGVKRSTIAKLADFFQVSPAWLAGFSDIKYENYNKQSFPLLGIVKAGYDYFASENIIGYVAVDKKVTDAENCYALQIIGDSMQPVLFEDDIIIIHKQEDVENGQIAIILIDNEEATVKKVIKHEDYIELVAFNSYYPPKRLTKEDNFKIIGKVIEGRISKIFE